MSKSLGNVVDPIALIEGQSLDVMLVRVCLQPLFCARKQRVADELEGRQSCTGRNSTREPRNSKIFSGWPTGNAAACVTGGSPGR